MTPEASAPRAEHFSDRYRWYVALLMTAVFAVYGADRVLLGLLVEPIKSEFALSDTTMGFIGGTLVAGTFALFIIPFGILADRVRRRRLLVFILSLWSLMTAVSGLSRSIVQLAVAQMLAALHESGGTPTMNSIISDLFPRTRRGLPISVWSSGVSLGAFLGFSVGGYLAEEFGWRMAFIGVGLPGLLLALVVWLTVRETPRGMSDGTTHVDRPSPGLRETLQFLAQQKALRHAAFAMCVSALASMGPIYWLTAFFQRSHGTSLADAGFILGLIFGLTGIAGAPLAGYLMDRLGVRDVRWHGWLAAVVILAGAIPMMGIYLLPSASAAFVSCAVWQFLTTGVYGINIALVNNLAPAQFRAFSMSLAFFLFYLIGIGFGSQVVGISSDWLAHNWGLGQESLRIACLMMVVFYLWAAFHYWMVARHVKEGYATAYRLEREPVRDRIASESEQSSLTS